MKARHPVAGALAFVLGGASLIGTLLTVAGSGAGVGRAAIERLAAWPFTMWTTITGVMLLVAIVKSRHPGGVGHGEPQSAL